MKKSDFALISALYDSKKGGLYTDVYFPIIKYTIVSLFYNKKQNYYTQTDVSDFIVANFGINIPTLVIKKSIVAISKKSSDFKLDIYDNGSEFKILKAWDYSVNVDIDAKAHDFDTHIDKLEEEYRKYVDNERIISDKSFLDFISDNTDDVLSYFENESSDKIDCEYAVMAYFLKHLQSTTPDLFKIASELFWGSIIAGFLKRDDISNNVSAETTEYYLDTPLIMGLLKLSSTENEIYSKEVFDIIKASGGIPKIHPITLEEVKSIISSVETSGSPIPNTPIEAAWYRDNLTKSKLANLRVNAAKYLENLGAVHFPNMSLQVINKVKNSYSNKTEVKELSRNRGGISSDRGIFRDIHDIFMDDYIDERRKSKGTNDSCFFVTNNTDLIKFCRKRRPGSRMRTIGSSSIILELWMHNTNKSGIENNALTEMIARCMDINNRDVRNKLGIVAKYYNKTKREDFDPNVFQEIARCLYKREKDIITAVDRIKEDGDQDIDSNMRIIVEIAQQSRMQDVERSSDIQQQLDSLQKKIEVTEQEKNTAINIGKLEAQRAQNLQNSLDVSKKTIQLQNNLLDAYKQKEELIREQDRLKKDLSKLESDKGKYIDEHDHFSIKLWMEIILIVLFFISLLFVIFQIYVGEDKTIATIVAVISFLLYLLSGISSKSYYIINRKIKHEELRSINEKIWEEKNPGYCMAKDRYKQVQQEIKELEDTISKAVNK